jgi:DNA polymerase
VARAAATGSAAEFLPPRPSLSALRDAAAECRGCHLWQVGTQTVFGEGAPGAVVMLVGEQPGDQEDLQGRPFVGPAGRLLDRCLAEAGIDRRRAYVTNVVKHFKWTPRGKRRIHEKPNGRERQACYPWLESEIELVSPGVIVSLGATAAQSLLGASFRLTKHRGEILPSRWKAKIVATIHPSALLRIEDRDERHQAFRAFVADLKQARAYARKH